MRKEVQREINRKIESFLNEFLLETHVLKLNELTRKGYYINTTQLRRSSANIYVISTRYIILQSYETVVTIYDVDRNIIYDVLRLVYGYTATSAQHIAKFCCDYGNKYTELLRWYQV